MFPWFDRVGGVDSYALERTDSAELSSVLKVLFPAFREVVGRSGYGELGEHFEDKEHQLFGEHGFENIVSQVANLERTLGIHDLERFTPMP